MPGGRSYGQLGNGSNLGQIRPTPTATLRGLCGVPVVFAEGTATQFGDGSFRVQFKSDLNRSYRVHTQKICCNGRRPSLL